MKGKGFFEAIVVFLLIVVILVIGVVLTKTIWESNMPMWLKILLLK